MAVLYRKYRPQTFEDVLNQKFITQTLKNQVKSGSISHAYLFTGSRGVGKTSVARILAKAVNCLSPKEGEACGVCEICKAIEQGSFLDLVEIDAASNTGVDNIRELIDHVKFSPSLGKYKVFIIDEVHMLSKGAFNALLKTLEEPPAHAIFILATTEINKVPATIISRTQKFEFKAYSAEDLLQLLEKVCKAEQCNLSAEVLGLVAQNAEGSARDSLSLLDKVMTLGDKASLKEVQLLLGITDIALCENLLELIALGKASEIPNFYNSFSESGLDYSIFNRDFLEFLRKVMVYKVTEGQITFGLQANHNEKLNELSQKLTSADIIFIIRLFLKSYKDLAGSPNPQVPLLIASIEAALKKSSTPNSKLQTESPKQPAVVQHPPKVESQNNEQPKELAEMTVTEVYSTESQITQQEAQELWPKVIAKVKEVNGPLASMLRNCEFLGVENGRVVLGVKFMFDKQSLESAKNASLISNWIEKLSGAKLGVAAQVIKKQTEDVLSPTEAMGEALKVFGGELVD